MISTKDGGVAWPKVDATTLADQVYTILRNRILDRELPPSTPIRELEVATALQVSRTPVREALNRLASQGFLEREPHRGFRVPDSSWETLLEVYPIVASLEQLAGALALPRITPQDIKKMKAQNEKLRAAARRGDTRAQMEANNAFHHALAECCGNQRLQELLDQLSAQVSLLEMWYFSVPENAEDSIREHEEIIDAIEARDVPTALTLLEKNYARGRDVLMNHLNRSADARPHPM